MCLAIPMRVTKIEGHTGTVEVSGVRRDIDLSLVDNVEVGHYVMVHAGFAIQVTNEEEAQKTLELLDEITSSGTIQTK